jgi:hypothetical protein
MSEDALSLSVSPACPEPPPHGFGMTAAEVQALIDSKPLAQQMAEDDENFPAA